MRAADATLRAGEATDGWWKGKKFAGLTALEMARKVNKKEMAQLLEEHAAAGPTAASALARRVLVPDFARTYWRSPKDDFLHNYGWLPGSPYARI